MQWDGPKPSGPALLFRFTNRWMPGVINDKGTFEFTIDQEYAFWGVYEGGVYKGSWDNNLPHGQGLLTWPWGHSKVPVIRDYGSFF